MFRLRDIAVAAVLVLFFAPLILFAAALVKLVSPGPAFVSIQRVGRSGKHFRMLKLRTMVCDAESCLDDFLSANPQMKTEWETTFKLKDDPRVIPVLGHFLRQSSIDELPQLFNVLKGDMSLVGPRPFPDRHLEKFDRLFLADRCSIRPGLTGMWQVEARNSGGLEAQYYWDDLYLRERSFVLDARILAKTALVVARGDCAY